MSAARSKPGNAVAAIVAGLVLAAGGVYWFVQKAPAPAEPTPVPEPPVETSSTADGSDVEEEAVPVDPKVDPRALLTELATRGSKSPLLAEWLEADGLIQRLAAAVRLVADGRSPRAVLGFIHVPGAFSVVESWDPKARSEGRLPPGVADKDKDKIYVARESYARYDPIAEVFVSADVGAWGRGYRRIRPYFIAVFKEIKQPGERFDDVLAAAIRQLVSVEVPEVQPALIEKGALFLFADPALESLSEAQKHVVRMGPKNAKALQSALRDFARNAGLDIESPR